MTNKREPQHLEHQHQTGGHKLYTINDFLQQLANVHTHTLHKHVYYCINVDGHVIIDISVYYVTNRQTKHSF